MLRFCRRFRCRIAPRSLTHQFQKNKSKNIGVNSRQDIVEHYPGAPGQLPLNERIGQGFHISNRRKSKNPLRIDTKLTAWPVMATRYPHSSSITTSPGSILPSSRCVFPETYHPITNTTAEKANCICQEKRPAARKHGTPAISVATVPGASRRFAKSENRRPAGN